jgi:hypothetical protein
MTTYHPLNEPEHPEGYCEPRHQHAFTERLAHNYFRCACGAYLWNPEASMATKYCGCCGRETLNDWWCHECKAHVDPIVTKPPHERTYFAQHQRDCPFQVVSEGRGWSQRAKGIS